MQSAERASVKLTSSRTMTSGRRSAIARSRVSVSCCASRMLVSAPGGAVIICSRVVRSSRVAISCTVPSVGSCCSNCRSTAKPTSRSDREHWARSSSAS
jgi:hypothetical protein